MTYLLTQMSIYMLCALILGVILGWLIWGRLADRVRKAEADRAELSAQLKARGDGSEQKAQIDRLNTELDACRRERRAQKEEIERLNGALDQSNQGGIVAASTASTGSRDGTAGGIVKPETLTAARGGTSDDLKLIKGVGAKMERMLNSMGFYHFDQIAAWTPSELAWVDDNLEGFKGRASRDAWVAQAGILARGGQTEFSARKT